MQEQTYQIRFTVPGFLGDAEQKSAWRAPPFKALIQHWWRIAVAKDYCYDWHRIREAEGKLFGHAWLKDGHGKDWAMRSRVRVKLQSHKQGMLDRWIYSSANNRVTHPNVHDRNTGNLLPMAPETYLAYGPLHFRDGLIHRTAIKEGEENWVTLQYPDTTQHSETLKETLQLIHWFGTVGGRSRNGWGSLALSNPHLDDYSVLLSGQAQLTGVSRPLNDCLREEWPHAIGCDGPEGNRILIWKTEPGPWREVVKLLAEIKIGYRTLLSVTRPFDERHILALPVTHHNPTALRNDRVANQMRAKIIQCQNQFYGIVFHLPCKMPNALGSKLTHPAAITILGRQAAIWHQVHAYLDANLTRIGSR